MATPENAVCLLFLHEIRDQAAEIGKGLNRKGIKCLAEQPCLNALINEWTMARLAWIDRLAENAANDAFRRPLKDMILDAVNTYDGLGKTRFVDYQLLILSGVDEVDDSPVPGSLFLSGFSERLKRIPSKSVFFPRKSLTPFEQAEIMMAAIQYCWTLGFDINSTLNTLRPKITAEMISLM